MKGYNGFGEAIRAARLGWHKLPLDGQEGYLRITDTAQGWCCELHPLGLVHGDARSSGNEYRVWWENGHGRTLIESSAYLRAIRRVKGYFSVVLDEDGMPVQKVAP